MSFKSFIEYMNYKKQTINSYKASLISWGIF